MSKERARLDVANAANELIIAALKEVIAELEKENKLLKRVEEIFNASPDLTFDCCKELFSEDFQAHNLEQQAKALNDYADSILKRDRLFHINLSERMTMHDSCRNQAEDYLNQAKALKEQVK